MKYAIVVDSKSGNTRMLANIIQEHLENNDCVYIGDIPIDEIQADILFVGFWTDKGSCSDGMKDYLSSLQHQHIFLFGTCGFGKEQSYYERILSNVATYVHDRTTVLGGFMCQGKMNIAVRERYVSMLDENPNMRDMIENFDQALSHPNEEDFTALCETIDHTIKAYL